MLEKKEDDTISVIALGPEERKILESVADYLMPYRDKHTLCKAIRYKLDFPKAETSIELCLN